MSYDITPAPPGADPEKWALHERGACGGYYKCAFCAAVISAAKSLEAERIDGRTLKSRPFTREELAARRRAKRRRRARVKAARRARKLARRRAQ